MKLKKLLCIALLLPSVFVGKNALACASEPLMATMCAFGGNFAPRGFALANGQLIAISQNSALFSLLGTTYGGDGRTTFALPDTRGRALIGAGRGPGLSDYRLGAKGGAETVTLSLANLASHNHAVSTSIANNVTVGGVADLKAANANPNSDSPTGNSLAKGANRSNVYASTAPNVAMHANSIDLNLTGNVVSTATNTVGHTGNSTAHENRMPYVTVNWIIATQGIYPSRN